MVGGLGDARRSNSSRPSTEYVLVVFSQYWGPGAQTGTLWLTLVPNTGTRACGRYLDSTAMAISKCE